MAWKALCPKIGTVLFILSDQPSQSPPSAQTRSHSSLSNCVIFYFSISVTFEIFNIPLWALCFCPLLPSLCVLHSLWLLFYWGLMSHSRWWYVLLKRVCLFHQFWRNKCMKYPQNQPNVALLYNGTSSVCFWAGHSCRWQQSGKVTLFLDVINYLIWDYGLHFCG